MITSEVCCPSCGTKLVVIVESMDKVFGKVLDLCFKGWQVVYQNGSSPLGQRDGPPTLLTFGCPSHNLIPSEQCNDPDTPHHKSPLTERADEFSAFRTKRLSGPIEL